MGDTLEGMRGNRMPGEACLINEEDEDNVWMMKKKNKWTENVYDHHQINDQISCKMITA